MALNKNIFARLFPALRDTDDVVLQGGVRAIPFNGEGVKDAERRMLEIPAEAYDIEAGRKRAADEYQAEYGDVGTAWRDGHKKIPPPNYNDDDLHHPADPQLEQERAQAVLTQLADAAQNGGSQITPYVPTAEDEAESAQMERENRDAFFKFYRKHGIPPYMDGNQYKDDPRWREMFGAYQPQQESSLATKEAGKQQTVLTQLADAARNGNGAGSGEVPILDGQNGYPMTRQQWRDQEGVPAQPQGRQGILTQLADASNGAETEEERRQRRVADEYQAQYGVPYSTTGTSSWTPEEERPYETDAYAQIRDAHKRAQRERTPLEESRDEINRLMEEDKNLKNKDRGVKGAIWEAIQNALEGIAMAYKANPNAHWSALLAGGAGGAIGGGINRTWNEQRKHDYQMAKAEGNYARARQLAKDESDLANEESSRNTAAYKAMTEREKFFYDQLDDERKNIIDIIKDADEFDPNATDDTTKAVMARIAALKEKGMHVTVLPKRKGERFTFHITPSGELIIGNTATGEYKKGEGNFAKPPDITKAENEKAAMLSEGEEAQNLAGVLEGQAKEADAAAAEADEAGLLDERRQAIGHAANLRKQAAEKRAHGRDLIRRANEYKMPETKVPQATVSEEVFRSRLKANGVTDPQQQAALITKARTDGRIK